MGSYQTSNTPNLPDFLVFVQNQGVPNLNLPNILSGIQITNGGSGYLSVPAVTIGPPTIAGGTQATATATLTNDVVTSVSLTNPGSLYLIDPLVTFSPPGGNGITAVGLADLSPWDALSAAYDSSSSLVYTIPGLIPSAIYVNAVYNLGMHSLVEFCPDQNGQTYFADLRQTFKMNSFIGGPLQSSSDLNTSASVAIPDLLKKMSFSDIERAKTPWGRTYLRFSQNYGPYVVGVT